jgi:hypothetical protein
MKWGNKKTGKVLPLKKIALSHLNRKMANVFGKVQVSSFNNCLKGSYEVSVLFGLLSWLQQ